LTQFKTLFFVVSENRKQYDIENSKVLYCTELITTQEGKSDVIPVDMCYLIWQESLDKLKQLVEPTIPDA
jgi:hypothetical protein